MIVLLCGDQNVLKILLSIRLPMQRLLKRSDARFRAIQEIEKDVEYAIRKYRGFRKSGHSVAHDDTYIMIYHTSDPLFHGD